MPFRTDDGQTACFLHSRPKLDVGTTTRHIGGNGNHAGLTCFFNNLCLTLVLLGIEHVVLQAAALKHSAEQFGSFDRGGTHQHRPARLHQGFDLVDYSIILFLFGPVNQVFAVFPDDRLIGGNHHHIELIYVPKLACFRFGRTGHTGQLAIHPEIVLQGYGGISLGGGFHFNVFLGFNGLMQPVGIAPALHDTAGLLVNNLDLVVDNHILHVLLEEGVGFKELMHRVQTFGLNSKIADEVLFAFHELLFTQSAFLQLGYAGAYIGQDEKLGVVVRLG